MAFKKLPEAVKNAAIDNGITGYNPMQKILMPIIASGTSVYNIAPKGSGSTIALIFSIIRKLKGEAFEDSPRALVLVESKEEALKLQALFEVFTKRTSLRTYAAYEQKNLDNQREEIYYGVDILIAVPKHLNKLYLLNSVDLRQLLIMAVDDAEFLIRGNAHNEVLRISESVEKRCQFYISGEKKHTKIERFENSFMYNSRTVEHIPVEEEE